jgi:hypothetical protein
LDNLYFILEPNMSISETFDQIKVTARVFRAVQGGDSAPTPISTLTSRVPPTPESLQATFDTGLVAPPLSFTSGQAAVSNSSISPSSPIIVAAGDVIMMTLELGLLPNDAAEFTFSFNFHAGMTYA